MMDSNLKIDHESNIVFNLDNNTQLEFLNNRKTVIIIDKEKFLVCKHFLMENAADEEFANFLSIPLNKVHYFKHKMQIFEDSIRAKRRAARLQNQRIRAYSNKKLMMKNNDKKREISSEERFKKARELIGKNYSTNQISRILKISERSVTRFKKRIREEKLRLKAEGKLLVSGDPDDDESFKYLSMSQKIEKARELFSKGCFKIADISNKLKISERSVRRWKDRLLKIKQTDQTEKSEKLPLHEEITCEDIEKNKPLNVSRKKRRSYLDRDKVQYARELIENGLSNKEMSMLLELSIACVRKLKSKILDGTANELIDDSEEHYNRINNSSNQGDLQNINDPLTLYYPMSVVPSKSGYERKPKVILSNRDALIVRLLREQHSIRTMDIAKLLKISERSVTRLLSKTKNQDINEYETDILEEVQRILQAKRTNELIEDSYDPNVNLVCDESKQELGMRLISMNTKNKDIANMLDVSEKTVQKWKLKMNIEKIENVKEELMDEKYDEAKEEYIIEYLD